MDTKPATEGTGPGALVGVRRLWRRLRGDPAGTPGRSGLRVRYLGGDPQLPVGPARLEVWSAYGAAVLWVRGRHLPFGLAAVQRVVLCEGPSGKGGQGRGAVGVCLNQARGRHVLWLAAVQGTADSVYLELLLLLGQQAGIRGEGAPPRPSGGRPPS